MVLPLSRRLSIYNLDLNSFLSSPETLGAAALKVAGLEQLAVDVVPSLQDHEVQVNLGHGITVT